ncbi:hypothetical protein [Dyadobacter frigoris]|uniref:YfhO family protein n=1 Tax=Dyadobacter frigoris TaxID=2576211 RepID=A0A4U6D6I1_9BACT|nr:hypothetical protein [Dyadobacter frigoris]TKT91837.1 hypothetical protein FDK13_11815 [Dyadobacter frigoris]GLU53302.1 hypothetical protein Dfri01_27630 [Dyadobacter frigoris]
MNKNKLILSGLVAIPIVFWVFVILNNSVNVPWYDDFDPFPDFLRQWINSASLSDHLRLLFQPNNEHRMVIGKLVTLFYYSITGHLNFTFLHIAGACFTLGTLWLFWTSFRDSKLKGWYFLPVPFLLFQLQYHLVFLWAICSLQHQPVIFFVSLSMLLLARNRFGWALLAAVCATYSMSNGIFVWVSGAVILILRSNYKLLGIWCITGAAAIGFYFFGLTTQGNESSIAYFKQYPHLSFLGFFAFLGGLFDFFPEKTIVTRSVLPVIMGLAVMVWIGIWLLTLVLSWFKKTFNNSQKLPEFVDTFSVNEKGRKSFQEFLLGILIFLLMNALVIGLLRPRFGFFVMIVSNYKMYPALFLIIAYLSFISSTVKINLQERGFQLAIVLSLLIWCFSIYSYLPVIQERKKYLSINGYNQNFNGYGLGHVPFSAGAKYVDILMKEMVAMNIYKYPAETNHLVTEINRIQTAVPANFDVWATTLDGKILIQDSTARLSSNTGQYAFVKNKDQLYLFKLEQNKYAGRNIFRQYFNGSNVEVPFSSLLPGSYDLGVVKVNGDEVTGGILKSITIP